MNGPARSVRLDDVPVGARLALDVCDGAGRVMLTAGAELSEASLASLRQRGVAQVSIVERLTEAERAVQRAQIAQRLGHLFRKTTGDPLMSRLHDAVLAYRLEQLQ